VRQTVPARSARSTACARSTSGPRRNSALRCFRPAKVETLLANPTRARKKLPWQPGIGVRQMCAGMVAHHLDQARRHALPERHGHELAVSSE